MSHASFGPTGSPLWLQNLADTETFRPILQSEIPPEWHRVDARQLAEAKRALGLPEHQPVRAVTCIELPDRQPFWGLRTVGEPARTPEPDASRGGLLGLISRRRPSSPGWSKRKLTPLCLAMILLTLAPKYADAEAQNAQPINHSSQRTWQRLFVPA